jgi:hypothetical protein
MIKEATFKPDIALNDVKVLYSVLEDEDSEVTYSASGTAAIITELTSYENEYGIEVPALYNPDPNEEYQDLLYVYRGKML